MTRMPLVSICIYSCDPADFVLDTLDSIAMQTYAELELVIIDNASSYECRNIINSWLYQHRSRFRKVVFTRYDTREAALVVAADLIQTAEGTFVSLLTAGSLLLPDKISEQVAVFAELEQTGIPYGVVYGNAALTDHPATTSFDNFKKTDPDWKPQQGFVFENMMQAPLFYIEAALLRRSVFPPYRYFTKAGIIDVHWYLLLVTTRKHAVYGIDRVCVQCRDQGYANPFAGVNTVADDPAKIEVLQKLYSFPGNSGKEKKYIVHRIINLLYHYTTLPGTGYGNIMSTWLSTYPYLRLGVLLRLLLYIHWFRMYRSVRT